MQTNIAHFLRRIPQSNQAFQSIETLSQDIDPAILLGFVLMLKTIGAVQIDDAHNIRAASQTAKYMLHSIASYIETDKQWIDEWHMRGVNRKSDDNPFQNAATLLHAMEKRRLQVIDNPKPSRSEEVAQVLIKRSNPHTQKPELLFQFDANANQFQLIGGRRSDNDDSLLATIIREIEEEVANTIHYEKDYHLNCVIDELVPSATLSPTFGALTEYHFSIFHMVNLNADVEMQPEDEWVPIDDMLAGYVVNSNDIRIPFNAGEIYHLINDHILGGLVSLPNSFRTPDQ
ncbi:MAG: NUDIX hydrolase [Anaerolineae bacterium]|nr:NUDIX hydrolase [Anaerolineae bacterium]MDQ7036364.1 NUDIX hydrolase [Anaerolineae bacterium]